LFSFYYQFVMAAPKADTPSEIPHKRIDKREVPGSGNALVANKRHDTGTVVVDSVMMLAIEPPNAIATPYSLSKTITVTASPPPNFGSVSSATPGQPWELEINHAIYRSSFPKQDSFEYLKKLKLKTILYVCLAFL
jgi:hypothetical protein